MGGAASARVTAAHAGARTVAGVARGAIVAAGALLLAILNARIRSSRHGRYPERWVGGLSHSWGFQGSSFAFGLQVAQSVVQLGSSSLCAVGGCDGGGRGTTRALHLLAAASTPAWRMVWKPEGLSALAMPGEIEQVAQLLRPGDRARTGRSEELLGVQVWVQAQIRRDALYNRDGAAVATWDAERAKAARAHTSLGPLPQTANETLVVPLVSAAHLLPFQRRMVPPVPTVHTELGPLPQTPIKSAVVELGTLVQAPLPPPAPPVAPAQGRSRCTQRGESRNSRSRSEASIDLQVKLPPVS